MAIEYFDGPARIRLGTGFIQTLVRALGSIRRAKAADHLVACTVEVGAAPFRPHG